MPLPAQRPPRAVCVGESMVVLVPHRTGPLEHAEEFRRYAGGAESNVAGALAGLGVDTSWVSRLGDDGFGRYLRADIADRGVDVSAVEIDPLRPTGLYVKETGDGTGDLPAGRSRMHYYRAGSAASAMSPDLVSGGPARDLLDRADLVHVTGITAGISDSATDLLWHLLSRPRPSTTVSFDLNWRPGLWHGRDPAVLGRLCALADVVLLGADEAAEVLGSSSPARLRELLPNPDMLVVKNDAHDAIAVDRTGAEVVVPALDVEVVEPVGAGDAFAAGYLAGTLRDLPVAHRLRLGHLCAARALAVPGDHGVPPSPATITALLARADDEWARTRVSRLGVDTPPVAS
ncbi:sugar kinase [Actinoalloteichus caeruleus]|uniref:sugar kinase n=1 Tax=Actinoalloteichus cyanogriseus TaxID=2893586 RepID=UPI000554C656|nr:sugar kinase [Actinoalloteichus caeruleus]